MIHLKAVARPFSLGSNCTMGHDFPKVRLSFSMYMFTEQYRLVAGLEEVFNHLFYDGRITNVECTKI